MDSEEREHYLRVVKAFLSYEDRSRRSLQKHFRDLANLLAEDAQLIPEYAEKLNELSDVVLPINQVTLNTIIEAVIDESDSSLTQNTHLWPTDRDYENLRSTLRQMVRDWSVLGAAERDCCYTPILKDLQKLFPETGREQIKVLFPGAGLGRLAYEATQLGFQVQGNEFSLYMLFTSQFLLNHSHPNCLHIAPFAIPLSNKISKTAAHQIVTIPDIQIQPPLADFSMTAGDFLEVYSRDEEASKWDCLVSCYFIDTAPNVLQYLRVIWRLLRPGGYWINHGPLQYHFEGSQSEKSIELTWEELRLAAERIGFRFLKDETGEWNGYASEGGALSTTKYLPIHSIAIKD